MNYEIKQSWKPGRLKYFDTNVFKAKEQYFLNSLPSMSDWPSLKNNKFLIEIKKQYPYAFEMYNLDVEQTLPGKIIIKGDGKIKNRFVVNMFTQYYPGYPLDGIEIDTFEKRKRYFISCLNKTYRIPDIKSLCMMEKVGLPFGEISSKLNVKQKDKVYRQWLSYMDIIQAFALKFRKVKTVIYVRQDNILRQIKALRDKKQGVKFEYID